MIIIRINENTHLYFVFGELGIGNGEEFLSLISDKLCWLVIDFGGVKELNREELIFRVFQLG
jgi:hypothetical protein